MLNPAELIIGPAFIAIDGEDMGFTTADGITYSPEFEVTEFESAQTQMVVAAHRSKVRGVISATFNQLSLKKWQVLEDIQDEPADNTLVGKWDICGPTQRVLVVTMPGPGCSVRTMTLTAIVLTPGEKVFANNEYTGAPVEFLILGDAEDESMWRLIETIAGGAAPAAASYQYLTTDGETVAETAFVDGAVNVPDDAIAVQITFNVAIRPDQLNSSKFLLMLQSNGIVSSTYKAGTTAGTPDYKKVIVTPVAGLAASTDYSLVVAPGVKSTTGKLSAGETVQFSTTA